MSKATRYPQIAIVDLDDTLIDGNSFHWLVTFLLRYALHPSPKRLWFAIALPLMVLARKFGLRSRLDMKRLVQRFAIQAFDNSRAGQWRLYDFIDRIVARKRAPVVSALEHLRQSGAFVVLSTAALPEYALKLKDCFPVDAVLATSPVDAPSWTENSGQTKAEATIAFLKSRGLAELPRILIADHDDDVPLARVCTLTLWVVNGRLSDAQAACPNARRFVPSVELSDLLN